MTVEIKRGIPPPSSKRFENQGVLVHLCRTAINNPGEWFHAELDMSRAYIVKLAFESIGINARLEKTAKRRCQLGLMRPLGWPPEPTPGIRETVQPAAPPKPVVVETKAPVREPPVRIDLTRIDAVVTEATQPTARETAPSLPPPRRGPIAGASTMGPAPPREGPAQRAARLLREQRAARGSDLPPVS